MPRNGNDWWKAFIGTILASICVGIFWGILKVHATCRDVDGHEKRITALEEMHKNENLKTDLLISIAEKVGARIPADLRPPVAYRGR